MRALLLTSNDSKRSWWPAHWPAHITAMRSGGSYTICAKYLFRSRYS